MSSTKRSQLYNSSETCVDEALQGLVELSNDSLILISPRIVVRKQINKRQVSLLSLGGSGHEPAHAGYVGKGMLTGAIAGNVFSSPPSSDILQAIVHVTGDSGCILIVKNYTGDVVNSNQAKEKAEKEYGLKVEIVIVADDQATIAMPVGARGLAGTVLYHKIGGALSDMGLRLEEIVQSLESLKTRVKTMGMSYSSCNLPGSKPSSKEEIAFGSAELGYGIHGEPGVKSLQTAPTSYQTAQMLIEATSNMDKCPVVVLLNNLGGLSCLEMLVFSRDVHTILKSLHFPISLSLSGSFMTSLDGAGVSLTLLHSPTTKEIECLQFPTNTIGWPNTVKKEELSLDDLQLPAMKKARGKEEINIISPPLDKIWIQRIRNGCNVILSSTEKLNDLDSKAGDGDTGTSLKNSCTWLLEKLDQPKTALELLQLALEICDKTGGSFGGISSYLFKGSISLEDEEVFDWNSAWMKGIESLRKHGAASIGDRSFIDALIPALNHTNSLSAASKAAREGANSTAFLHAKVGRACYVPYEKYSSFNDAGAEAIALFLAGMNDI